MAGKVVSIVLLACLIKLGLTETLVWEDDFQTLDHSNWFHQVSAEGGGPDHEFQYYRNDSRNSYIKDGVLYIKPTLTADEYDEDFLYSGELSYPGCNEDPCASTSGDDIVLPILSASIISVKSFKYGRYEIRAQMPRGDWIWPTIWMYPTHATYGKFPRSGEIVIAETRGNKNYDTPQGLPQGIDTMTSSLHWGPDPNHDGWLKTLFQRTLNETGSDYASEFHLYGLEWTEKYIKLTVDGVEIATVSAPENGFWHYGGFDQNPGGENIWEDGTLIAPFDIEYNFILNVAVGGNHFPPDWGTYRPWNTTDGHPLRDFWKSRQEWLPTWIDEDIALKIDYIRVYSLDS